MASYFYALLFLLTVEIFSNKVQRNPNIQGVKISNKIVKISQLAYDTICIASDLDSVRVLLNKLYMFSLMSGLKLNCQQTEMLQIGLPITIPKTHSMLNGKRKRSILWEHGFMNTKAKQFSKIIHKKAHWTKFTKLVKIK